MKIKKYFLKIMASLVVSASFLGAAVIPGQAIPTSKYFQKNVFSDKMVDSRDDFDLAFEEVLKDCQCKINQNVNAKVEANFGKVEKIDIDNEYLLTRERYQHIAYGDYSKCVHNDGLHMKCGLDSLEENRQIFIDQIRNFVDSKDNYKNGVAVVKNEKTKNEKTETVKFSDLLSSTSKTAKQKAEMLEEYLNGSKNKEAWQDLKDGNSELIRCKLDFTNANYDERYIFPEDWNFENLRDALKQAIDQRKKMEGTFSTKFDDIKLKAGKVKTDLNVNNGVTPTASVPTNPVSTNPVSTNPVPEDDRNKLYSSVFNILSNVMDYRLEKLKTEMKGEVFPNLYGYANQCGKSMTVHSIKNPKDNGKNILVALVTLYSEVSGKNEIVTFYPINVQNLKEGEFAFTKNMLANPKEYTAFFDIFFFDKFGEDKFLRRLAFDVPTSIENNHKDYLKNSLGEIRKNRKLKDGLKIEDLYSSIGETEPPVDQTAPSSNSTGNSIQNPPISLAEEALKKLKTNLENNSNIWVSKTYNATSKKSKQASPKISNATSKKSTQAPPKTYSRTLNIVTDIGNQLFRVSRDLTNVKDLDALVKSYIIGTKYSTVYNEKDKSKNKDRICKYIDCIDKKDNNGIATIYDIKIKRKKYEEEIKKGGYSLLAEGEGYKTYFKKVTEKGSFEYLEQWGDGYYQYVLKKDTEIVREYLQAVHNQYMRKARNILSSSDPSAVLFPSSRKADKELNFMAIKSDLMKDINEMSSPSHWDKVAEEIFNIVNELVNERVKNSGNQTNNQIQNQIQICNQNTKKKII